LSADRPRGGEEAMLMRSALSGGGWRLSRRLALCLAIVALPIIVAPSAMATEPMRSTIQLSLHFDPWNLCPAYDFHIVGDFDITRDTITFYNEEGNAVRMIQVNTLVGTLANSVTGYSLQTQRPARQSLRLHRRNAVRYRCEPRNAAPRRRRRVHARSRPDRLQLTDGNDRRARRT
jgi:hypothetical protein